MAKLTQKKKRTLLKQQKPKTFTEKDMMEFGERIIKSYLASSIITLRDKFGFGKVRIERFLTHESEHARAIKSGHVTTKDILDQMKLEIGFDLAEFINKLSEEISE